MQSRRGKKEKRVKKRKFTAEEDGKILSLVKTLGEHAWIKIAKKLSNRTPRQCRERWKHYLVVNSNNSEWTKEEDSILMTRFHEFGTKWTKIAEFLPGRTSINIKNRYALLKRRKNQPEKEENSVIQEDRQLKEQIFEAGDEFNYFQSNSEESI